MGNVISPCFQPKTSKSSPPPPMKLIFSDGIIRTLSGSYVAGEIMFKFPDKMVCHADSFFIGHPVPVLAIDDLLMPGQIYFVLPIDSFASSILSSSSLVAMGWSPSRSPIKFGECPFEHVKGTNGRVLIKVTPEFIARLISGRDNCNKNNINGNDGSARAASPGSSYICSTTELKKHYEQLVGPRDQMWSPKLDTISEYKVRFSPCKFIGLEWKEEEVDF